MKRFQINELVKVERVQIVKNTDDVHETLHIVLRGETQIITQNLFEFDLDTYIWWKNREGQDNIPFKIDMPFIG